MGSFDGRKTNNWVKLIANVGLLLADSKFRNTLGKEVRNRVGNFTGAVSDRYETAVDRLDAASAALQGYNPWPSRVTALLLGVGIGTGLGMILAPASGSETRQAIRDKTAELKDRVVDSASNFNSRMRASSADMPTTGTEG